MGRWKFCSADRGKDLLALTCAGGKVGSFFENRLLSLYVIDIDGDGRNEIIAGSEDKHLYFLDEHGGEIWRHDLVTVFQCHALDLYRMDR